MSNVLTERTMKGWGPHKQRDSDVLVYSMGSLYEGHGPALSPRNDDLVAQRIVTQVSELTGFPYMAHLPFSSDRVGEIARDWCPAWMEPDYVIRGIVKTLKGGIENWRKPVSHAVIISGHGGNNFLKDKEKQLSDSVGVPVLYVVPFDDIVSEHDELGPIRVGHANHGEHSVAAYMNLLNRKNLDMINEVAAKDPKKALENWKPLSGLGWYVLFGGDRYETLRSPQYKLKDEAEAFMGERKIVADADLGKDLYDKNFEKTINQVLDFTAE